VNEALWVSGGSGDGDERPWSGSKCSWWQPARCYNRSVSPHKQRHLVILGLVVIAGVGALVWALVATRGAGEPSPRTDASIARDGVPSVFLVVGYRELRPIDPATGRDLPGYIPLQLSLNGAVAISPDSRTAAVARHHFALFDLERWKPVGELGQLGGVKEIHWSSDGRRLYVRGDENCQEGPGFGWLCESRIETINVTSGKVVSRAQLPSAYLYPHRYWTSTRTDLAPKGHRVGRTLYLFGAFGNSNAIDTSDDRPTTAHVVAFDLEAGKVQDELDLPGVLWGVRPEPYQPDEPTMVGYYPAVAVSPDGRRAYIVHADADRVTVVDLEGMRVERSDEIGRRQASLFERFLSSLAGNAYAKDVPIPEKSAAISRDGGPLYQEKWAAISPDGRFLYVGGVSERFPTGSLGLQVIDTGSLDIVAEITPGGDLYADLAVHPSGRYLYAVTGGITEGRLLVLDPVTLEVMAHRLTFGGVPIVAPARGLTADTP